MAKYFGVVGNRDYIKLRGEQLPFWHFLDNQPDGWLVSLAYMRDDLPHDARTIMIFDCGAWTYRAEPQPRLGADLVTPEWAFERYRQVALPGDFVVAPDHMLIPGVDLDARRSFNRQSAARFLELAADSPFSPMAPVHGETLQERIDTARRLVEGGYAALALGGLAARASRKAFILDAVAAIREAVPPDVWVHVLGLSSPEYAAAWRRMGVQSFDGASHFRQAFTAGVFFALGDDGELKKHLAARPGQQVGAPQCDCRACSLLREDDVDTRRYGSNESNMGRAAHNMNMLMRAQKIAMGDTTVTARQLRLF